MFIRSHDHVCCRKALSHPFNTLPPVIKPVFIYTQHKMSETAVSSGLRAEDVLTEIRLNLLECKVCFETFSLQKRDQTAQNLPCGHVLCLRCVFALSRPVHKKPECPFCRKRWDVGSTSECRALADLQELLLPRKPSSDGPGRTKSAGRRLQAVFGGWGTLVNPTGIAVDETSGQIFVTHDAEKRVAVFSKQGTLLNAFGRPAEVCYPLDVALTETGHVLVTDAGDQSLKVFTPKGRPLATVPGFELPWSVAVDDRGRVLVSDALLGSLHQVVMDFLGGVVLAKRVVLKELTSPRSVASCRSSGNIAIAERLRSSFRLRVFSGDFAPLTQVDAFGLCLRSASSLVLSAVAFDGNGDVVVGDVQNGMVWSLGDPQKSLELTPLASGLTRPAALAATETNGLVVLDAGDHSVNFYTVDSEDLYCD
ncbi:E3 ubiquitin-protein ligase NHLRC1-like [Puntigrus tetrazona]|uniref:E3 ubiquitin-protein ligase NHLRC1-like n=1 Tax=Puntigrus tetrazona TaxID=1606681 RepID=UPI001C8A061B|nr:E3 ubiquitin-protein ligase NHLRC1-like [Puntigrus tetrazona]